MSDQKPDIDPAIVAVGRDVLAGETVGTLSSLYIIEGYEAEELARDVLEAAAPLIAARALREAADGPDMQPLQSERDLAKEGNPYYEGALYGLTIARAVLRDGADALEAGQS